MSVLYKPGVADDSGFTLIELVIIIVVLAVLATVAIPVVGRMLFTSKETATKKELLLLKSAITGRTDNGVRGYENDVGTPPPTLSGLVTRPGGVPAWDRFTKSGWNGPYVDSQNNDYLSDAWGTNYIYDPTGRTIRSIGGPDTLTVVF